MATNTTTSKRQDGRSRSRPGLVAQRQRIMAVTAKILGQQSYEDTTVQHVLRRASISRGTFYRCFDSLESVLRQLYENWEHGVVRSLEIDLQSSDEPREIVLRRTDRAINSAVIQGPVLRTLYREGLRVGSPFFGYHRHRQLRQAKAIAGWWSVKTGVTLDVYAIVALHEAILSLCVEVCDARYTNPEKIAATKAAARSFTLATFAPPEK